MSEGVQGDNGAIHLPNIGVGVSLTGWPLVGLASCIKFVDQVPYHSVATQYVPPITDTCKCLPFLLPAVVDKGLIAAMMDQISGLVLPGSTSNVDPEHYGATRSKVAEPYDPTRDATTMAMIEIALDRGIPLLAICRGLQELNVACGGTLHPAIQDLPGRRDHRVPDVPDRDDMFKTVHSVSLTRDSIVGQAGFAETFDVCSLHGQGIDQLGRGLRIEAAADDGTIEMLSMPEAKGFVLAVQWHPEYLHHLDENSTRIFRLFADAVHSYAADHRPKTLHQTLASTA